MPVKKKLAPKKKKITVDRKFLTKLANRIYNPADRSFLRLCDGKLQNGPDPTNDKRPMHCGLGELYYAMTGRQPEDVGIDEEGVVELAVDISSIAGLRKKTENEARAKFKKAASVIEKLDLDLDLRNMLVETVVDAENDLNEYVDEDDRDDDEHHFRVALNGIPNVNDSHCGENACSFAAYRTRAQRVAAKLREAAKLIP